MFPSITISVIVMAVILIGTSFALFNDSGKSTSNQVVSAGTFNLDYSASVINTQTGDVEPSDETGATSYSLSVNNTGSLNADYNIILYTSTSNVIPHSNIKVKIDSDPVQTLSALTKTSATASETNMNNIRYVLKTPTVNASATNTHIIKVWVDENIDDSYVGSAIGVSMLVEGVVAGTETQE